MCGALFTLVTVTAAELILSARLSPGAVSGAFRDSSLR